MKIKTTLLLSLWLTAGLVLSGVSTVWAAVAANTQIVNEATLSYGTGPNARTITASVTVTVSLVPAVATITGTGDRTTPYTQTDTPQILQFVVTANSNGPETYTVTATNGTPINTTGPDGPLAPPPFVLGASVTTSGSTTAVIRLPSDGNTDGAVNGLQIGDTVVIDGERRAITAISDPASGNATIALDNPLASAPGPGIPVQEQKAIDVFAYSGTVQNVGDDVVLPINVSIGNGAGTTSTVTQSAIYTTSLATLTKYVRNVSRAAGNATGTGSQVFTFNSMTTPFYTGGVTAQSGDLLEYVLLVQNIGNGAVPNMRIDDKIPVQFVTIDTGAYGGKDLLQLDENGAETTLTVVADGDAASVVPPGDLLVVYIGTGAVAGAGGSINPGKSVLVSYRATIQ